MNNKGLFKQNPSEVDNHPSFKVTIGLIGFVVIAVTLVFVVGAGNKDESENAAKKDRSATTTSQAPDSWQTYHNEEFGFTFKHPDWMRKERENFFDEHVSFFNYKPTGGSPSGYDPGENRITAIVEDLDELPRSSAVFNGGHEKVLSKEQVSIRGQKATRTKTKTTLNYDIPLKGNQDKIIRIDINGDANNFDLLDKLVSTLKFSQDRKEVRNNPEPGNWQTYRNEEWGFSIFMPERFTYSFDGYDFSEHSEIGLSINNTDYEDFAYSMPGQIRLVIAPESEAGYPHTGCEYSSSTVSVGGKDIRKCVMREGTDNKFPYEYYLELKKGNRVFRAKCDTGAGTGPAGGEFAKYDQISNIIATCDKIFSTLEVFEPKSELSLGQIAFQYTEDLKEKIRQLSEVRAGSDHSLAPLAFIESDHDQDGQKSLFVGHAFEGKDQGLTYEIIRFDIDAGGNISNPQHVLSQTYSGWSSWSWHKDSPISLETTQHNGKTVMKSTVRLMKDREPDQDIEYNFYANDKFYRADSRDELKEEMFLAEIKSQYTEEFVSDPAFLKEGSSTKGDQTYEITADNREPLAFSYWDHDKDGEESLAVLNEAGSMLELMLFDINNADRISNPRLIDKGGGTWIESSVDLEVVNAKEGIYLRRKVRYGQSAPVRDYFSFQDDEFASLSEDLLAAGGTNECSTEFIYPESGDVLKQGNTYMLEWKLPDGIDVTDPVRVVKKSGGVAGKIPFGAGIEGAEWNPVQVYKSDKDFYDENATKRIQPGKYRLIASLIYNEDFRQKLLDRGCELSDERKDGYYRNKFKSGWFTVK